MKLLTNRLKQQEGFSLIELLVAMALISLIMMISINIMVIVGKTARTVDYQVNVTQESAFAAERIRRVARSADSAEVHNNNMRLTVIVQGIYTTFSVVETSDMDDNLATTEYIITETTSSLTQSVMSSDVYITKVDEKDFFSETLEGTEVIGVRMLFQAFDCNDINQVAGTVVSTQAINRSLILN